MKSVCLAAWYLTIAFGNLIVVIVAESKAIDDQVYEYVFFAGLLAVATLIFFFLSYFYKYVEKPSDTDNEKNANKKKINSVVPVDSFKEN